MITTREWSTWIQSAPVVGFLSRDDTRRGCCVPGFPGSQPFMALKSKELTWVTHRQKAGLPYSAGSSDCVACPDFPARMAKVINSAHTLAYLLGKSWGLFVVSARTGGSWDLSERLQMLLANEIIVCLVIFTVLLSGNSNTWSPVTGGDDFWNLFSKKEVNLVIPEKKSKH